ncbi:MAG TPA: hypothetical protein VNL35_11430 [Chloroflexota bacterium]|jgi:hypothetical protein|nr:hypothetical protein [Chloroflexota bacterium]
MRSIVAHIVNEDPFLAEMTELPKSTDTCVEFFNPRTRDGKPLRYASPGMSSIFYPMHRVTFIEVMANEEERAQVVEFFRERGG